MIDIKSRNGALLLEFVEYCKAHPHDRFWQALRNWAEAGNFIWVSDVIPPDMDGSLTDTFYWEGKNK